MICTLNVCFGVVFFLNPFNSSSFQPVHFEEEENWIFWIWTERRVETVPDPDVF